MVNGDREGWKPQDAALLYLFWEPTNWHEIEECRRHHQEIERLTLMVNKSRIKFRSMSYAELWQSWEGIPSIRAHVSSLKTRYIITVRLP